MTITVLKSGRQVYTGLLLPESRPTTFAAYADVAPMLTREQIEAVILDNQYVPRRQRFPKEWIGNQGAVSSCNGYAGAKALERARVLRGQPHVTLSGEFLYSLINGGRDQGSMLDDGMHALRDIGVAPESMVPRGQWQYGRMSAEAKGAAARFKGWECYRVDTDLELASGLALGFVGVVAVHVDGDFDRVDSDGRVPPSDGPGNHAVGVDDLRLANDGYEFDMFNSWGLSFGQDGRGWLSWSRHFRTTSRYHAFYLIRSAIDDFEDENPPVPQET